ncbi:MAG: hypothetical protein RMK20_01880 [Verrucomicrobiales bacterium]|nr:hypothetical protein [Verrucomicrobiales bacterium]
MKRQRLLLLSASVLLAAALPAVAVNVTFRVNMSVQTAMGQFNPETDLVFVAGSFNGWSTTASPLTRSQSEPDIWEGTFNLTAGTWPNYKFVKQVFGVGVVWEVNGVGPNGDQNRWFQVPGSDTVLPVVYFNNITNVITNHVPVTFRVNMSVQIAQGSFNPATGTLAVSGDAIDNWANLGTHLLTQSPTNSVLWEGTFQITNAVGAPVNYKFIMNGNWETRPNRTFIMTNVPIVLPIVWFNDVTNVAVPIPVTFTVNMGVAMARGQFNPDNGDFVEARGSFLTGPGGAWLGGFVLTNSPTSPIVYSGTFLSTNHAPGSTMLYQFVINGNTWETTGDRTYLFTSTNAVVLPVAFLNNVTSLGALNWTPLTPTSAELSWQGGPRVRLQSAPAVTGPWQDVPNTENQNSAVVNIGSNRAFFRLVGP